MKSFSAASRSFQALAVVAAAAMLSACATVGGGKPEDVVAKRAQAYWDARIKGDSAAAYALLSPSYRKLRSQQDFGRQYAATSATEAQVKQVQCADDRCKVSSRLQVTPFLPGANPMEKPMTIETYSDSIWLLQDGQWWLYLEP